MPINDERFRVLLEKIDPKVKLRRLEEELDGNEQKGMQGLREQLLATIRTYESQQRLIKQRLQKRPMLSEAQLKVFDEQHAMAELNLAMVEGQCELIAEEIEITEAQIADIKGAGLTRPAPARPLSLSPRVGKKSR